MKTFRLLIATCLAACNLAWAQAPVPAAPASAASQPAPAQLAQSPASAHGFFLAVLQSQVVTLADGSLNPLMPARINQFESSGCFTKLAALPPGPGATLSWKDVRSVRAENDRQLRVLGPNVNWVLGFETRDMADRAGRALNTVRRSCDPVEGFGF